MDRAYRLEFCEKCENKAFSPKQGIVCALTNQPATFNGACPDFQENEKLAEMVERNKIASAEHALEQRTYGLSLLGVKSGASAGIVWMAIGGITIFLTIYLFDLISFWSILIIVFGLVIVVKSAMDSPLKRKKKSKPQGDLLDDF